MPKLSIIISVYNKFNFTKSCLNDLSKLDMNAHEIIVIDNASTDETQNNIKNYEFVKYIRNEQNFFHSKACNIGFANSSSDYICFLNNDIRIKSDFNNWTNKLIELSTNNIVGPAMGLLDNNFNFIKEEKQELIGNSYLVGWCLCSSRENWHQLLINNNQIFDENFPFYFNDTDLGFRIKKLGLSMKVVDIPVVHFGKVSASQLNVYKLYTDARKKFVEKWKPAIII